MESIALAPGLRLGIDVIDEQHGRFFELVNRLITTDQEGAGRELLAGIIGELAAYVVEHFTTEEQLMERCGYPDIASHQMQHARFAARVEDFHAKYQRGEIGVEHELLAFLVSWFTDHVRIEDAKYADLFRANGL